LGGIAGEGGAFRNPSRGERRFDIADALIEMIERRIETHGTHRLGDIIYQEGYSDGLAVPLPALEEIDFEKLGTVRSLEAGKDTADKVSARGFHIAQMIINRIERSGTRGKDELKFHCQQSESSYFAMIYSILRETKGLRENEWKAGWHYVRNLDKRSRAASDEKRKAGYNLQLLEFAKGVMEHVLEERYAALHPALATNTAMKNGDHILLRQLLAYADRYGIAAESRKSTDDVIPEAVRDYMASAGVPGPSLDIWRSLARGGEAQHSAQSLTDAHHILATIGNENPFTKSVASALYLRAYIATHGEQDTGELLAPVVRETIMNLIAENSLVETTPLTERDTAAVTWAISELLAAFSVFSEPGARLLQPEKIIDGAIIPLGIKGIAASG
jgi:hypothetical protein